jgi:transcriptional regulator with XRE-family HTH domain
MSESTFSIRELARLTGWDRKKISGVFATLGEGPTLEEIVAGFITQKSSAEPEPGLFSQSDFHRLTGLDRATIADRLETVASRPGPRNSKLYSLADALPALIAGRDVSLDQVKLKTASHREKREEIELRKATQELADRREVRTEFQEIFKALHRRLRVQFWREHAAKLHKAKSARELAKIGCDQQDKIWNALRSNYKTLTGSD